MVGTLMILRRGMSKMYECGGPHMFIIVAVVLDAIIII